jgi:hypothetical protein
MHNEDAGFTGPDPDVNIVEVDEDSTPGFGNEQRGEDISMDDKSCIREHATNMVKIRGVKAGRLAFDLWYEHAQTTPQLSVYTPIQPLVSDGALSSSSILHGTSPT